MTDAENGDYSIEKTGRVLVFRTTSFSVDTTSVLHTGIYNREFTSVLAAMAVAGLVYTLLVVNYGRSFIAYAAFILLFVGGFSFFRKFVFRSRYLEAIFDRDKGSVEVSVGGLVKKTRDQFPLNSVGAAMIETIKTKIENPDGVEFVEKISLQHGMAIPGFGEEKVSYQLKLKLTDGSDRIIFTTGEMKNALSAHEAIKEFLEL
ncbi:MAG: hypothetical protein P8Z71_08025 [Candidatus Sulfobium sp.]|jgi:hypothetical protein